MNTAVHLEEGFFSSIFLFQYKSHFPFCTYTADGYDYPWENKAMHSYSETSQSENSLEDHRSKIIGEDGDALDKVITV